MLKPHSGAEPTLRRGNQDHVRGFLSGFAAIPPILDIEGTARVLRCSIDRVRRIPRWDLPRSSGPGKHCLFLLDDVLEYVRRRTKTDPISDELNSEEDSKVADFLADKVRNSKK